MSEKNHPSTRLVTVRELSKMLGISPRTIYNGTHRRAKKKFPIKPKRIGKLIRFDVRDIEAYINSL
jgi:predicted DNA-binding transcriptional regulator AlpA